MPEHFTVGSVIKDRLLLFKCKHFFFPFKKWEERSSFDY